MIRDKRSAIVALGVLVAACATPNSAPVRTIQVVPTAALDDDLKRLDKVVLGRDFLAVPTYRDRVNTAAGPVDVIHSYEFRDRRTLKLTIGWELQTSRYRLFVTDVGRGSPARGLECRKYLELFSEVSKTFGPGRVTASDEHCDPLADGG
jgi:hypothetical protein